MKEHHRPSFRAYETASGELRMSAFRMVRVMGVNGPTTVTIPWSEANALMARHGVTEAQLNETIRDAALGLLAEKRVDKTRPFSGQVMRRVALLLAGQATTHLATRARRLAGHVVAVTHLNGRRTSIVCPWSLVDHAAEVGLSLPAFNRLVQHTAREIYRLEAAEPRPAGQSFSRRVNERVEQTLSMLPLSSTLSPRPL